jgi:hypothetical protein
MKNMDIMHSQLLKYFLAEKHESLLFMLISVAAIVTAIFLFKTNSEYKGMAYPLIAIALIQLVVGGTVYFRTYGQIKNLAEQLKTNPSAYKADELARMQTVNNSFKIYKAIEIVLLLAGILMTLAFRQNQLLCAIAVGVIIQSSIMLVLDLFAEKRAEEYARQIQQVVK